MIKKEMDIHDYDKLIGSLGNLQVTTQRKAIEPTKRRANINSIKGAIQDSFAEDDVRDIPLGKPLIYTFENSLRRSRVELPNYEFKQGLLSLDNSRKRNLAAINGIIETICGMANIEPNRNSYLYIGVSDSAADAKRAAAIDSIGPVEFEGRYIVGVARKAKILKSSLDDYIMWIKNKIAQSKIFEPLLSSTLSKLDCFVYKNFDIVRIVVPGQDQISFVRDKCLDRHGSSTAEIRIQTIPSISRRFQ